MGMFIDWIGILLIIVPIFSPILMNLGFDPLWVGLVICTSLQISFLTPPFAYSIFYLKGLDVGLELEDVRVRVEVRHAQPRYPALAPERLPRTGPRGPGVPKMSSTKRPVILVTEPLNESSLEYLSRHGELRRATAEPVQPRLLQVRELLMDLDRHEVSVAGQPVNLTSTEFEFLRALMQHPDHAFTRLELIERALGYEYEGLERTVDSHIKNLRRKIEPDPKKPIYVETVYGVGYRLQGEP